jgi:hypothetical protein
LGCNEHGVIVGHPAGQATAKTITVWLMVRILPAPPRSLTQTEISRFLTNSPELEGFVGAFCFCKLSIGFQGRFRRLCLCPAKLRFPATETGVGGDSVRMLGQCHGKPSITCCLDHSASKSVRPAMPMPCGSRPFNGGFDEIRCEEGE